MLGAGADVVGLDLPGTTVPETVQQLSSEFGPGKLVLLEGDVRRRQSLEAALSTCQARLGSPSILVNNAGIDVPPVAGSTGHTTQGMPIETWRPVLEVNLLGAFQASQVFGGPMLEGRRGSIVNIGSLYASVSPDQRFYDHIPQEPPFLKPPAYGASKAALVNLTGYLATLWAERGVRVNALSPGGVLGDQDPEFRRKFVDRVPMRRMAEAADLMGPLLFLVSEASRYVTGIELRVDGGFTAW